MQIITYQPLIHYPQVADLWHSVLGETYSVSERVLFPRIFGRNTLELGDGLVAIEGKRVVEIGRAHV